MSSTPTGASSRLLTMKFMQRAAAAASPATPGVSPSEDERPSKRVRRDLGSSPHRPQTQSPLFDQKAAQAALDAEAAKRAALIERQAEKLGDAHWKLDPARLPGSDQRKAVPLNIVQVGFSQIDRRDALETTAMEMGGPTLRSYRPKTPKKMKADEDDNDHSSSSDSDSDSSSESDSDSDASGSSSEVANKAGPANTPGRASYGTQKRQELKNSRKSAEQREKARKFAEKRRGKDVNLNNLTSISGAGASNGGFGSKGPTFGKKKL